jgi:hypothetical protein
VQETPDRKLKDCAPEGLGVGWMAHLVPSHRSANVTSAPALFT